MKRKIAIILSVLSFVVIFANHLNAATWIKANVMQVGHDYSRPVVILTHYSTQPIFKNKRFYLNITDKREMLAVALTAASMGKPVVVILNSNGTTIDCIRMIK